MYIPMAAIAIFFLLLNFGSSKLMSAIILACGLLWWQPMACLVGVLLGTALLIPYLLYRELRQQWIDSAKYVTLPKRIWRFSLVSLFGQKM